MASEPFLGVRPAHEYLFLIIASPAGAYFPRGVQPVSVYLSEDYIRAAPGGTGDIKCAGNYAASLLAQEQAIAAGCDQVVWLDAVEKRYVEEMGGMNLFFVLGSGDDAELVTPALTGTLLPGITRDSLHRPWPGRWATPSPSGCSSVDEWRAGVADGTVTETFACGTAAVITPVGEVKARTGDFVVGDGTPGPLTMTAARVPPRHPARAGGRHPRLAAPGRLSDRTSIACCAGGGWRPPRVTWGRTVVTIGVFDGVHRGHQQLIGARGGPGPGDCGRAAAVVVTFDPHPAEVVRPGSHPAMLTALDRKAELVDGARRGRAVRAAVHAGVLPAARRRRSSTTCWSSSCTPRGRGGGELPLRPQGGRRRRRCCARLGRTVRLRRRGAPRWDAADDGDVTISSTYIRACVDAGDVVGGRAALGRPHRVEGVVVRGDQRGRELGFPTANLQSRRVRRDPGRRRLRRPWSPATRAAAPAASGSRPRSRSAPTRRSRAGAPVEAYVLDFDGDLYGEHWASTSSRGCAAMAPLRRRRAAGRRRWRQDVERRPARLLR